MLTNLEPLIKLSTADEKAFAIIIKKQRKLLIKSSKETAKIAMERNKTEIKSLLNNAKFSEAITKLRQLSYDEFLREESLFNAAILSTIGEKFSAPKAMLDIASEELLANISMSNATFRTKVGEIFGTYAGNISPYIYQLCLSNTNSRRSRAGKTFEGIIYFLYEHLEFKFDSQAAIGKRAFANLGLGKVVDSILPSTQAFQKFRNKTIVGSMKTTLRERWQEVVEEIQRSNLPNIYLLTVDEDISESKAEQMSQHNIVLVVLNTVKLQPKLQRRQNIMDFETYFSHEIPEVMAYWAKQEIV